jgi:hypothetical protein
MKRKLPLPLVLYPTLLSMGAVNGFREGFAPGATTPEIVWGLSRAAFMLAIAIGMFRLWPFARFAAIVYCWFVFAAFAVVLLAWCVSPNSMSVPDTVLLALNTALHVYIYIVLLRPATRALFDRSAGRVKA